MTNKFSKLLSGLNFKTQKNIGPVESEADEKIRHAFESATQQQLFDIDWYEDYCGKFSTPLDGFKDYLYKSTFSNVNPSARFDTEGYLRSNLDIYYAGTSPLLHYMYHGKEEARRAMPAHLRWHPKDELIPEETENWAKQKIAICLHIYYDDFIEKFAESLTSLPCPIDVFVACGSEEIQQKVESSFKQLANVINIRSCIVPNRGRNFGPFLVEFSTELLEYDLMCHLHSKKSLYSGREQTQWFDYLNQYLLKDRHVVACILRLFDANPEFGMYYPTSFWMMPSWVNHWTCNKSYAADLVTDWDIDITNNFVNYPVGGMFWARPKALIQLLQADYDYADFPEEPLANDGSWLHALERSLGLLVEKNDFKQFFYYPAAARFTLDPSYIYTHYHKSPELLFRELKNFEVVSFDVFDTILRREFTEPDYAKLKLGQYLYEQDLVASPDTFLKLRNDIEHDIRQERSFIGDVSIIDVYKRLAQVLVCDEEQAREFMEMEFYFDFQQIFAKDEMINIVNHLADLGREIWFVTDTYYCREHIEKMLRKIGIAIPYTLFVSSELGYRKDAGTMWKFVKEMVDEGQKSFIHVGDNVRADAQICGDYGLANMHILHPIDKWQASGFDTVSFVDNTINEKRILKWGKLISNNGRYPFFGE